MEAKAACLGLVVVALLSATQYAPCLVMGSHTFTGSDYLVEMVRQYTVGSGSGVYERFDVGKFKGGEPGQQILYPAPVVNLTANGSFTEEWNHAVIRGMAWVGHHLPTVAIVEHTAAEDRPGRKRLTEAELVHEYNNLIEGLVRAAAGDIAGQVIMVYVGRAWLDRHIINTTSEFNTLKALHGNNMLPVIANPRDPDMPIILTEGQTVFKQVYQIIATVLSPIPECAIQYSDACKSRCELPDAGDRAIVQHRSDKED